MKRLTETFLILLLLLSGPALHSQVITNLDRRSGGGVVTDMTEETVDETDYAAKGILSDWSQLLDEFDAFDEKEETQELQKATPAENNWKGPLRQRQDRFGRTLTLPYIEGENGEDLFLLTDEGINIYLALDAPVYFQVPDAEIIKWIRFYAMHKRKWVKSIFRRYGRLEPWIKQRFAAHGVPAELAELCLIESGCNYEALSPAGAYGMWQIMPDTGRSYGLQVDAFGDDRRDPVKATEAAASILAANYRRTKDWTLAAAAYNCGAGRFQGRNAGKDWEQVRMTLPKETQGYIPALLAMHYAWTYRKELALD